MALSMLTVACAAAVACWDDQQAPLGPPRLDASVQRDTGLLAVADAWIEQDVPNVNHGTSTILRIRLTGKNRALLRWDQQALQQAVGADSLVSATLEITYSTPAFYWEQGAKALFLHRLTQAWTEAGATWNCAVDEVPADGNQNCGGSTQWNMTSAPPIVTPATASFLVQNGSSGTVQLTVTNDVRAWLAGAATNHGWLLKKELENISGLAEFGSRESGTPPRLVLSILSADTSAPPIPNGYQSTAAPLEIASPIDPRVTYQRNRYYVSFASGAGGPTVQAFLTQFQGTIVGGFNGSSPSSSYYVVQVPDPGATWAAVDSLVARMSSHPGVASVSVAGARALIIRGRYPTDSEIAATRNVWFQGGTTVWPWVTVRAPLAWGCETGMYGGHLPVIGLIDGYFDSVHADFDSVQGITWPTVMHVDTVPVPGWVRDHAIGVAGVMSARGDNGAGGVGMIWRSRLRAYMLRRANLWSGDDPTAFRDLIRRAATDGVRVLNVSLGLGLSADTAEVRRMREVIKEFLGPGANRVIVQAVGNDNLSLTIGAVATSMSPFVTALDRALAQLYDTVAYRERIVFVTGVNRQGNRHPIANAWTGPGTLAAPADSIRTLAGASGAQWAGGTSFASPMVAGVAALLWSFDSTLTGADVKRLLVEGAQEPHIDPATGAMVTPAPVPNAGGAFLLDAYGALVRAARERPNSPVCGYPVHGSSDTTVTLASGGPSQRPLRVPGMDPATEAFQGLSVAQGGRVLSAALRGGSTVRSVRFTHTGAGLGPVANDRRFLERDTVDVLWSPPPSRWPTFVFRRAGGNQAFDAFARLGVPDTLVGFPNTAVSPTGTHIATMMHVFTPGTCDNEPVTARADIVPVSGAATTLVSQTVYHPCAGPVYDLTMNATWSHDGRLLALLTTDFPLAGGASSRVTLADSSGAIRSAAVGPLALYGTPRFSAGDLLVVFGAWDSQAETCTLQVRRVSDLVLVDSRPGGPADCATVSPVQDNLRLAEARSRPALGTGATGYRLFTLPRGLAAVRRSITAAAN